LYGHPVGRGRFTVWDEGVLETTRRGISLSREKRASSSLLGCGSQTVPPEIDGVLVSALLQEISTARDDRLLLTAEWLQPASGNSTMVSLTRGALRR
jgi:hypothetical protein